MKPKIQPIFSGLSEIRMGSPFKCADLELMGEWVPNLPHNGWQDIYAHSENGKILALVRWASTRATNQAFDLLWWMPSGRL